MQRECKKSSEWVLPGLVSFHGLGFRELDLISHVTELFSAYLMGGFGERLIVVLETNLLEK